MKSEAKINLHNRFDIEVIDARTGEIKQKAYAENILLNAVWGKILRYPGSASTSDTDGTWCWWTYLHVGSGSGTLAASRTTLFTEFLTREATNQTLQQSISENWISVRKQIAILETEFNGTLITEVGIGKSSILLSHALLKDMNGNPVSILKVDTDIITVYATVYVKISPAWTKDASIGLHRMGAAENYFAGYLGGAKLGIPHYAAPCMWPSHVELFKGDTIPTLHKSTLVAYSAPLTHTFDVANKKDTMYCRIPAASANVGGIKSIGLIENIGSKENACVFLRITEATNTQAQTAEQIGIGNGVDTLFDTSFPFVRPGAVIKVDGVVSSPTVLTGIPKVLDIKEYIINLGKTGNGQHAKTCYYPAGTNTDELILENPFYESYGIDSISCAYAKLYTSDDMVNWTLVYTNTLTDYDLDMPHQTYSVAAEHKQKRYWKAKYNDVLNGNGVAINLWSIAAMNCVALNGIKNVVFDSAPASGAVITAEYDTDVAAKDANHAFDITVVVQLGEYTP